MFKPEIIYIQDSVTSVVKLEPIDTDADTEPDNSVSKREKIGDIYRTSPDHLAFVCAHCAAEFSLFVQFIDHIQLHLQKIQPLLCKSDNATENQYTGVIDEQLKSAVDLHIKHELDDDVADDPIVYNSQDDSNDQNRTGKKKTRASDEISKKKKCRECGLQFKATSSLSRHMTLHRQEKRYLCDMCPESYARSDKLLVHKRTHSLDFTYKCEWCPRSFPGKRTLKKHMTQHTGESHIKCTECHLKFTSQSSLNRHMPTHTQVRRYLCDMCPKSYLRSDKLLAHRRSHTNEFIYKCKWCPKGFPEKRSLKRHTLSKHGKEWDANDQTIDGSE